MSKIDELNQLSKDFDVLLYYQPSYAAMYRIGITTDDEIEVKRQQIIDDIRALIYQEMRRLESKRKIPLLPCKCGYKHIKRFVSFGDRTGKTIVYKCDLCLNGFEYRKTDQEARLAWNEKMGKDGAENG